MMVDFVSKKGESSLIILGFAFGEWQVGNLPHISRAVGKEDKFDD